MGHADCKHYILQITIYAFSDFIVPSSLCKIISYNMIWLWLLNFVLSLNAFKEIEITQLTSLPTISWIEFNRLEIQFFFLFYNGFSRDWCLHDTARTYLQFQRIEMGQHIQINHVIVIHHQRTNGGTDGWMDGRTDEE